MLGRLHHRFDFRVECGALSHVGQRDANEDVWHGDVAAGFFVLADGMGGHAAGEIAAATAVRTVLESLDASEPVIKRYAATPTLDARRLVFTEMQNAAQRAHAAVKAEGQDHPEWSGLGSTLDLLVLAGERAFVLHVGDARVYLVRPEVIVQLTNDHDIRAIIGVQGSMPPPSKTTVPNRLLNAIGISPTLVCDCVSFEVATGDRLIMCTDGVHQMIKDEAAIGHRGGLPGDAAHALVDSAIRKGGRDNATAVVVDVREPRLQRKAQPASPSRDLEITLASPLLSNVPRPLALRLLSAAVEVELGPGRIPRIVARDRVAYIVLEGEVQRSDGASLGPSAVLYGESLVEARRRTTYETDGVIRAVRIRSDDFREVCAADPRLAAALYEKLARHLAQLT